VGMAVFISIGDLLQLRELEGERRN
jgi:hypothetical protein